MWLGQAIHSHYQENALEADSSYRREVSLQRELVVKGWTVALSGRADGIRRTAEGVAVVEEIKSVRRGAILSPALHDLYRRQALIYGWMLQPQEDRPVVVELVLIEIGTDEIFRETLTLEPNTIELALKALLRTLLFDHEKNREVAEARRARAASLPFPHGDFRPGQEMIVEAVTEAMEEGRHLLVEAPTGIGKTVTALYPALRYALAHDKRIFVLTAKTLQQDMSMKVLRSLQEDKPFFHGLKLRAKAKMCANNEVICHEDYCAYARNYWSKIRASGTPARLLERHGTLDPEDIYVQAERDEVCPFEVSLDLVGQVQVTVCDYNYAFGPYVALSDFSGEASLADTILIIDEIHNLVERGRGYYSPSLESKALRETAQLLAHGGERIFHRLSSLLNEVADLVERWVAQGLDEMPPHVRAMEGPLPEDELWLLRPRLDEAFIDYLEYQRETKSFRANDLFVAFYFDFLRFINVMVLLGEEFSTCLLQNEAKGSVLQILCKDPSRFLGAIINRCHSVIGLSATLSPSDFYRDLLGFTTSRTDILPVPHPFPEQNRAIVIDSSIETTYRRREQYYGRIGERIGQWAEEIPGHCLILFPSYQFMERVREHLDCPTRRILVQERNSSDISRDAFLEALRQSLFGDILLLAVAGGVFAEGVDYPGRMLSAVAVVGPCLPGLSLERELLKQYYDERFERGFEYSYVVPGMTRVVQAAGRLLRSPEERGVIALFDRRFLTRPYSNHLPAAWLPENGPKGLIGDPARVARRFYLRAAEAVPPLPDSCPG